MTNSALKSARRMLVTIALAVPLLAVAAHAPGPGHAEVHAPTPVMPPPLDPKTEKLKSQVLELTQQTNDLQRKLSYPAYSRVSVYLGVQVPGLLVQKIEVSIDGGAPVQIKYSKLQSIALLHHSLDRVLRINATPGRHRLHAVFTGHYSGAKLSDPPLTKTLDAAFRKSTRPARLEIEITKASFVSAPTIRLIQWIKAS